jgi:cytochrome P450
MMAIVNFIVAIWVRIGMVLAGLWALPQLIWMVLTAKGPKGKGFGGKVGVALGNPKGQRLIFTFLRAFIPNLSLKAQLVKAYANNGTVIVNRMADVREVIDRNMDFEVVYEPKMRKITGGANFFLGMQDTALYQRDTSNMRLAMRRDDVARLVQPPASSQAAAIVAGSPGRIDVPQDLTLQIPTSMVQDYFGIDQGTRQALIDGATKMFWYLFIDLAGDPAIEADALRHVAICREAIAGSIEARKGHLKDDVISRCLALQSSGTPGLDDTGIRDNMVGLLIGAIPTLSKASILALDQIIDRPDVMAKAQTAARSGDQVAVGQILFEGLRFNPMNPIIYRRAALDTVIAANTLRACRVRKGQMVFAGNFSGMFDPLALESPGSFQPGRPWHDYILWGAGMHTCFGDYINRAVIPAMLTPLLARPNLRRAKGAAGQIDSGGTPFPQHWVLEFDA